MEMVNLKINGIDVSVPKGSTVLEAAHAAGIEIPTLCYMKELNEIGACRICVCEVKGARGLVTACVYPVTEGMEVTTNSKKLQEYRKMTLEMILSTHDRKCLTCVRSGNCELQELCRNYGVETADKYDGARPTYELDTSSASIIRDNNKCILCRRCVAACKDQAIGVIGTNDRGFDTHIGTAFDSPLGDVSCVGCGQCIVNCPVGALRENDSTRPAPSGRRLPIPISTSSSTPHRPCVPRSARSSATRWAQTSRARWLPPCAASALTRSSTPTSAQI